MNNLFCREITEDKEKNISCMKGILHLYEGFAFVFLVWRGGGKIKKLNYSIL